MPPGSRKTPGVKLACVGTTQCVGQVGLGEIFFAGKNRFMLASVILRRAISPIFGEVEKASRR